MELRHLRYFVAVAEERHFGRAAERLFLSQPPLSQQIQQLERELGVTLLARTNRRVELTDAGRAFLEDAREILARVDRAAERARRTARGEAGWIGVGFVGSAIYDVLPEVLRTFRARYPAVELVLLELLGDEQSEALREGRIHVGFSRLLPPEVGLHRETVARATLVAAVPEVHPLAERPVLTLAEVAQEPLVLYPRLTQSSYAEQMLALFRDAGLKPRVAQETGEMQTAVSLVAAGIGVALVPATVRNLGREGVAYRPLASPDPPTVELTMAYREGDPSPVLPHFLDVVREVIRNHPAGVS